jgi:DNA-binding transcriptional MerR regulator
MTKQEIVTHISRNLCGEEIEKLYYSVGEVAAMFGVKTSMVRFWETEFPQLQPKKHRTGDRQYTKEDIELVRKIHHLLKVELYTIPGARKRLAAKEGSNGLT